MTYIKVKYRSSSVIGKEGVIYYQIIHNRAIRQVATGYHIRTDEWDEKRSTVVTNDESRKAWILTVRENMRCDLERINRIIARLTKNVINFTSNDIAEEFKLYKKRYSFIHYMGDIINNLKLNNKTGTAENYRSALNSFMRFQMRLESEYGMSLKEDIMLDCISSELMERYESWQKKIGNVPNTISFYIRIFRAVYMRAVEEGIIDDKKPFKRVYTGVDKTGKRALPLKTIREIKSLDLSLRPKLDHARDIFFLSFFLRGMSFVDLCFLRKTDLKAGKITYRRRKTGQQLTIAWTKDMQQILDKYPSNKSDYLLPIITKNYSNERCAYKNAGYRINRNLKKIGEMVGAPDYAGWSLYNARHSWASLAKEKGIPISVISEALGHDNEKTTQIYLASLEKSVIDQANDLVISLLES